MTPLTNSGMTVMDRVETVIVLSRTLSRRKPGEHAQQDRRGHDDDEREAGEEERVAQRLHDGGDDRLPVSCSDLPQLPVTKWLTQVEVPLVERPVGARADG